MELEQKLTKSETKFWENLGMKDEEAEEAATQAAYEQEQKMKFWYVKTLYDGKPFTEEQEKEIAGAELKYLKWGAEELRETIVIKEGKCHDWFDAELVRHAACVLLDDENR